MGVYNYDETKNIVIAHGTTGPIDMSSAAVAREVLVPGMTATSIVVITPTSATAGRVSADADAFMYVAKAAGKFTITTAAAVASADACTFDYVVIAG